MNMWLLTWLLIITTIGDVQSGCGENSVGTTSCVLLTPYYKKYQWATCLTDAYIQTKSARKHHCRDRTATYCWYQCQIEINGLGSGDVYDNCKCKPDEVFSTKTPLPSWCYSPPGDTCNWYIDCLERQYPCKDTSASYAVNYANHFCNLYAGSYNNFSDVGRRWVNSVRKCLQVALVPLLRQYQNPTCSDIQDTAFDSHTCCYVAGSTCTPSGSPSICDLPFPDWLEVISTIKGVLDPFSQQFAPLESIYGAFGVSKSCIQSSALYKGIQDGLNVIGNGIRQIQCIVTSLINRKKRSIGPLNNSRFVTSGDKVAFEIAGMIAKKMKWNAAGVDWFSYATNGINSTYIRILIFNKDRKKKSGNLTVADKVVEDFKKAVINGLIKTRAISSSEGRINIQSFGTCFDLNCEEIGEVIVPPPISNTDQMLKLSTVANLCLLISMVITYATY